MLLGITDSRSTTPGARTARTGSPWVHGAIADTLLGWCWLPVAVLMHSVESSITRTQGLMAIIFLISFAHQPLTLGLVYGDGVQFRAHRRFYVWTPLAGVVLIVIGLNVSLTVVALIAGLWNAEHTLMQRYGVLRIYGRKAGDDHGRIEKSMLITWLGTALLFLGAYADLPRLARSLGVDGMNRRSLDMLQSFSNVARVLFWIGAAGSLVFATRWVRAERVRPFSIARRAKWIYAAGTLGLVVAVMVDPLAGVAGYVAAHAIEYFGIVHSSLSRRAATGDESAIARASGTFARRAGLYGAYFAAVTALMVATLSIGGGRPYAYAILFFGALHILYDGFVWKLRRPAVAASLGITAPVPPQA